MRARRGQRHHPAVRKGRMTYEHEFKLRVEGGAARPPDNRIKTTVMLAA